MSIEVIVEDVRWAEAGLERLAVRAADTALAHLGFEPKAWDISLLGCDDARIAALNTDFRDKPGATNVLSWPSEERSADADGGAPMPPTDSELGDIALAFETCQREAAEQGKTPEQHILHLIVHGLLHLLGYDHVRDGDADLMESLEIAILRELGVPNPYV